MGLHIRYRYYSSIILCYLFSASLMSGCSTSLIEYNIKNSVAIKNNSSNHSFTAGVAIRDITPPPGMPKGGYSISAHSGDGFRTKLKARAFYLNDKSGNSIAIVQLDLATGSLLIQRAVAERLAKDTDIDASNLVLTATHTHAAPGNYFASDFYNKHTSNEVGLAVDYSEFLINQISDAVREAYQQQVKAKVAFGSSKLFGYNRNRSLKAWLNNFKGVNRSKIHSIDDNFIKKNSIDPSIYILRIDALDNEGNYKPIGAFSSFSAHAIAITATESIYSADIFAYVHQDISRNIKQTYNTSTAVIHGAFNSILGDMNPALPWSGDSLFSFADSDWRSSKRLGKYIAEGIWQTYKGLDSQLSDDLVIKVASREVNIREQNSINNTNICNDAAVGSALVAGAEERRTPFLSALPFIRAGSWGVSRIGDNEEDCQGKKRILGFDFGQSLLEPKNSFPNTVPFSLVQIGNLVIVPLPFEITKESGEMITKGINSEYKKMTGSAPEILIASAANGYFGYSATPKEYQIQEYEGAHTLYGKNTTPYLAQTLKKLTADMLASESKISDIPAQSLFILKSRKFYPEITNPESKRKILVSPKIIASNKYKNTHWFFEWQDIGPDRINFHEPLLSVEYWSVDIQNWLPLFIDGIPISDEGYDIEVKHIAELDQGMSQYAGSWYIDKKHSIKEKLRFVVSERDGQNRLFIPITR